MKRRSRVLAQVCILLFALSTVFPVVAGVIDLDKAPRWLGIADVIVAAILCSAAIIVASTHRKAVTDANRLAAFRVSQMLAGILPALLALFFIFGHRVNWEVFVIGLAWRSWLLLYTLPYLAAALAQPPAANATSFTTGDQ